MANSGSIDCPCTNITIMQLFHELKQRYPTVPDQIVSKVIQENCHDKNSCESILEKESRLYLQSYPGAIISGNRRGIRERKQTCKLCSSSGPSQQKPDVSTSLESPMLNNEIECAHASGVRGFSSCQKNGIYLNETKDVEMTEPISMSNDKKNITRRQVSCPSTKMSSKCDKKPEEPGKFFSKGSKEVALDSEALAGMDVGKVCVDDLEKNSFASSRTWCSECDSDNKLVLSEKSKSDLPKSGVDGEVDTFKEEMYVGSGGVIANPTTFDQTSVHKYQVAVQYSMQSVHPVGQGHPKRSFTTVNLSLRPPSSEPQPPIEIGSSQNLTYSTSVFDAKKGVQSQFHIMITPGVNSSGGGKTVSAYRAFMSPSQTTCFCRTPYCTPQISTAFYCHDNHHLKALIEKQKERRDLLAKELRKEKDKLRCMQNEVKQMKKSIAQKPSPHLLPKLKTEIERLRRECEKLTAAVDLFTDTENTDLPLGETDEEFYRNIYTGQSLQREGSWSCQLCTFRNHPLLSVCEECEMPRISLGTNVMDVASHLSNVLPNSNSSFCTGGGTSTSSSLITAPLQVNPK